MLEEEDEGYSAEEAIRLVLCLLPGSIPGKQGQTERNGTEQNRTWLRCLRRSISSKCPTSHAPIFDTRNDPFWLGVWSVSEHHHLLLPSRCWFIYFDPSAPCPRGPAGRSVCLLPVAASELLRGQGKVPCLVLQGSQVLCPHTRTGLFGKDMKMTDFFF